MKKTMLMILGALLVAGMIASPVLAQSCGCGKKGREKKCMGKKVIKKIKMIYENQEALKVSDAQLDKLKEIKIDLKKSMIKKKAEIDLAKVDVKTLLYDDPVDVQAINALVDKKYDLKAEKTKVAVAAYAEFKKVLSVEQKEALKKICKEEKKRKKMCPMGMMGKGCPMCALKKK